MKIKILLVDDHQIVLKGISFFLSMQPDFELVGEAQNGKEAVEKAGELQPDIVLMDLNMPVMDGIEASAQIAEQHPHIKVLVLTSFSDRGHILPALQTGAVGYMLKDVEPEQLAEAIRSAYMGNIQLHPDISAALLHQLQPQSTQALNSGAAVIPAQTGAEAIESLTPREQEVLQLLTKGLSNKEIAQTLVVAEKTVKTHVSNILGKLRLSDRTQAALYAVHALHPQE
ncbi:DNA-binding response regulator [Paenibacillus radicis (ex Gao et al. 2016)]|uniref:DNA-binding response regulator n=1 Tax=Paenibacillus radicis (ex Gao et al. 2016) TaxID=1737354 RepID=A0A917H0K9_9BACL|nr:response regulator transcription factor [Paenibacillus radicis (ex Gao et al. 2016)]GGG63660.1 DNA-binding response regulator [Paenibacillus radicis (ex Gao et al. 2016)]